MCPQLGKSPVDPVQVLFDVGQQGILATPPSPPPRPPAARSKTLAGVKISSKGAFSLQRIKRSGTKVVPAAKVAERLVGRTLGITRDDKDVTKATLDESTAKFKDQLALEVIMAMRDFFHLDDSAMNRIEDALLVHGGQGALELAQEGDAAMQNS
ncbi:hypothetical protein ZWY2020_015166 [Hordeum vulgare]|nr:hypothetical protein ZWY2020_015166 [Hordeum vulgare]